MEATTYTGVTEVFTDDAEWLYEVNVDGHKPGCWKKEEHALHAADQCASLAWPAAGVACSVTQPVRGVGSASPHATLVCRRLWCHLHAKVPARLEGAEDEQDWLFLVPTEDLDKLQREACEAQKDVPSGPGAPISPEPGLCCIITGSHAALTMHGVAQGRSLIGLWFIAARAASLSVLTALAATRRRPHECGVTHATPGAVATP